jgi:hypothetical protein
VRPIRLTPLALLALLACDPSDCQRGPVNQTPPEDAAKVFLTQSAIPYKGVSCTGGDTDYDGYVTCTVNLGDGQFLSLQCAAVGAGANDCPRLCVQTSPYTTGCKRTADKVVPQPVINVEQRAP